MAEDLSDIIKNLESPEISSKGQHKKRKMITEKHWKFLYAVESREKTEV